MTVKNNSVRAVAILAVMVVSACSGSLSGREGTTPDGQEAPPWLKALFPTAAEGEIRIDGYPGQKVLLRNGRVYGSDGEDMPGQVIGMLAGLALSPSGPRMLRVGQVGFGTGVSAGVALAAGSRMVDVFEADPRMVRAGRELASASTLVFQEDRLVHPSLRIVDPARAVEERFLRYDVLVSPPATTAVVGIESLLTVERIEALNSLLGSGGVLVHHLPVYGMQPETYRRFLRTFARAFPYMLVLAAGPGSGDTFLIGSSSPLQFRPSALRTLSDNPSLTELWRAGGLEQPMDLAARVVFSSRQEVLAFSEGAVSVSTRAPVSAADVPPPPPLPTPQAPTAERATFETAWQAYQERFERLDLLRQQMWGIDWSYGQVCPDGPEERNCLLTGIRPGAEAATAVGALALSLMAAGRFVEAQLTLDATEELAEAPQYAEANHVLALLLGTPSDLSAMLPDALPDLRGAIAEGRCPAALAMVPAASNDPSAPADRLVISYALVTCQPEELTAMETVATLLTPLLEQGVVRALNPLLSYLLARSAIVSGEYPSATWLMLEHVRALRVETPDHGVTAAPPE